MSYNLHLASLVIAEQKALREYTEAMLQQCIYDNFPDTNIALAEALYKKALFETIRYRFISTKQNFVSKICSVGDGYNQSIQVFPDWF